LEEADEENGEQQGDDGKQAVQPAAPLFVSCRIHESDYQESPSQQVTVRKNRSDQRRVQRLTHAVADPEKQNFLQRDSSVPGEIDEIVNEDGSRQNENLHVRCLRHDSGATDTNSEADEGHGERIEAQIGSHAGILEQADEEAEDGRFEMSRGECNRHEDDKDEIRLEPKNGELETQSGLQNEGESQIEDMSDNAQHIRFDSMVNRGRQP